MKRILLIAPIAILALSLTSCGAPPQTNGTLSQSGSLAADAVSAAITASSPTTAVPTATPFGEVPDSAGEDGILFDIYQSTAAADINLDGTAEQLKFAAGNETSTLYINDTEYTIDYPSLAQCFAVADIDTSDSILELGFTDAYHELYDGEEGCTLLFWWDGEQLYDMGPVIGLKFDGAWRASLHPAEFFDGQGLVQYVTRTSEFTDVWYMGRFLCDGAKRELKEEYYAADPLYPPDPLTLKTYCVLLNEINSDCFDEEYAVIWDYASGYGTLDRDYSDSIVSFIPQEGETLNVVRVYGQYWFKLEASDGKTGWLKCEEGRIQGIWQVMGWEAADIFDGIVIAG